MMQARFPTNQAAAFWVIGVRLVPLPNSATNSDAWQRHLGHTMLSNPPRLVDTTRTDSTTPHAASFMQVGKE